MLWIGATLTAAFLLALINTADKFFLTTWIKPRILLLLIGVMQGITACVAIRIAGLDPISPPLMFLAFCTGGLFFAYVFLILSGIQGEEVSRVLPLLYIYPLIVLPFSAFFLGESLTTIQYWGIGAIIAGAVLTSVRENSLPRLNKSLLAALSGALIFGLYSVLLKYLLSFADFWSIFFYTRLGMIAITIPLIIAQWPSIKETIRTNTTSALGILLFSELIASLALFLHTLATKLGPVSIVSAL
ncbi:MAG: EamA family transporter, partial [Candidatus Paceibacteria bacterium]